MTTPPGPVVAEPSSGALTIPAAEPFRLGSERWLLTAIALGAMLAPLNSTMIAVALPEIQHSFGVSVTATSWLVTLYLAAMAAGQPIGGRLGDQLGRRPVYLFGLAWFAIASAGCAFAPNLAVLIIFRTQQALAGALSFPNGTAMVREAVPEARRASAYGMIGLGVGMAAASGPPIGGLLVHYFGWSAIFWANVPVVIAALILGYRTLPRRERNRNARPSFDLPGSGLFAAMLCAVIVIPTLLKFHHPVLVLMAGGGAIGLGFAFVLRELHVPAPVVDVRLFRESHFAAACASIGLSNLVMYTTLLALPLYLERVRNHEVQVSGLILAALSAFSAIWGPLGGRWTDRRGRWLPAVTGAVAVLVATVLLIPGVRGASLVPLIVALSIMGVGIGLAGAPVQTAAVEAVPGGKTGSAAGIFSTSRYLGSVTGSSVLAIVFTRKPVPGDADRFALLFAGLAIAAVLGLLVNTRIAPRTTRQV